MLVEKREVFGAVFSEASWPSRIGLSRDEIFGLFNLRYPNAAAAAA